MADPLLYILYFKMKMRFIRKDDFFFVFVKINIIMQFLVGPINCFITCNGDNILGFVIEQNDINKARYKLNGYSNLNRQMAHPIYCTICIQKNLTCFIFFYFYFVTKYGKCSVCCVDLLKIFREPGARKRCKIKCC